MGGGGDVEFVVGAVCVIVLVLGGLGGRWDVEEDVVVRFSNVEFGSAGGEEIVEGLGSFIECNGFDGK